MFFRLPIPLYRARLGSLLGRRFVLINHIGRRTGQQRQVVVEVVERDPQTGAVTVAAGFGKRTDWSGRFIRAISPAVATAAARSNGTSGGLAASAATEASDTGGPGGGGRNNRTRQWASPPRRCHQRATIVWPQPPAAAAPGRSSNTTVEITLVCVRSRSITGNTLSGVVGGGRMPSC